MGRPIKDLTGQVFGRLTALRRLGQDKRGKVIWECVCICGEARRIRSDVLLSGGSQSCGCLRREVARTHTTGNKWSLKHGHSTSRTYTSWCAMIKRCTNPNHPHWLHYGGTGVKVDSRWQGEHGFENFLADMKERPAGTSIGRFGDVGKYERSNCAWQTPKQQGLERTIKYWNRKLQAVAA